MKFKDNASLDSSRVSTSRGRGRGAAVGGGGLGIVGVILALVLGVNPADLVGAGGGDTAGLGQDSAVSTGDLGQECRTGADANAKEQCRIVGLDNSLTQYWTSAIPSLEPPTTRIFQGSVSTGCGQASSAVGPFYCPPDQGIFLDLGFFDELQRKFGAKGGDFAQAYVLAHEYGHHVQSVTGTSERSRRLPEQKGPQGASTRLELQADCYAGVWAANAQKDGFLTFDDTDIDEGLSAAAAVGDDRIQEASQGRVDPESWTHGSAEQRQKWFRTGLSKANPRSCDTFSGRV